MTYKTEIAAYNNANDTSTPMKLGSTIEIYATSSSNCMISVQNLSDSNDDSNVGVDIYANCEDDSGNKNEATLRFMSQNGVKVFVEENVDNVSTSRHFTVSAYRLKPSVEPNASATVENASATPETPYVASF